MSALSKNKSGEIKKSSDKHGFTLMEMLIVVAIIAILVVIAIPIFNSSMEKSRQAADEANVRAAKAMASIMYLNGEMPLPITSGYFLDAATGKLQRAYKDGIKAYGQTTKPYDGDSAVYYKDAFTLIKYKDGHKGMIVQIYDRTLSGEYKVRWVSADPATP